MINQITYVNCKHIKVGVFFPRCWTETPPWALTVVAGICHLHFFGRCHCQEGRNIDGIRTKSCAWTSRGRWLRCTLWNIHLEMSHLEWVSSSFTFIPSRQTAQGNSTLSHLNKWLKLLQNHHASLKTHNRTFKPAFFLIAQVIYQFGKKLHNVIQIVIQLSSLPSVES